MRYAPDDEKKKALAAALRENLKRRKVQARGRKAEGAETHSASHAGAPTDAKSEPRDT